MAQSFVPESLTTCRRFDLLLTVWPPAFHVSQVAHNVGIGALCDWGCSARFSCSPWALHNTLPVGKCKFPQSTLLPE